MPINLVAFVIQLLLAPLAVDPDPLTVDTVLTKWCQASQNIKQFDANFTRVEYNSTFQVERHQIGRFYYRTPGQGRLDLRPAPARKGVKFEKVVQTMPVSWVWTGEEVVVIDEAKRTFQSSSVPDETNWWFWWPRKPQACLPLVVDVNEESLRRDFEFKLTQIEDSEVRLSATPLTKEWGSRYQSIAIILDREDFHVKAIKYVLPGGGTTFVDVFTSVKINEIPLDEKDIIHPDLEKMGYRNAALPETAKP